MNERQEKLRRIPSVERLLAADGFAPLIERYGRDEVKAEIRRAIETARGADDPDLSIEGFRRAVEQSIGEAHAPSLRPVINGSGVMIHTNLGRSPISREIWTDSLSAVGGYSNLEYDLDEGARGARHGHVARVATRLFGCEGALLVNNNAGAVLLVLAAIAAGREVIVSRGELVEIGGSFRVPDVITQGGARLREVGTTNRTRARDIDQAIGPDTAAILSVHQSNFQIVGFTEAPSVESLVATAAKGGVPLVVDEGSGHVVDLSRWGFVPRETVRELIEKGVDVVTCSTDKLIGASQGGLILGRKSIIDRCARHPLMRALRPGKESYAIVTATLDAFLTGHATDRIPLYRMLDASLDALRGRAEAISEATGCAPCVTESAIGGGTTPTESIASIGIVVDGDASKIARTLLRNSPPIVGRVREDRFMLDLRTIDPADDGVVVDALRRLDSP